MDRWAYKVVEIDRDGKILATRSPVPAIGALGSINDLGADGWKLVSLWPNGGASATVMFRRPVRAED
jgi:hypothetical protein